MIVYNFGLCRFVQSQLELKSIYFSFTSMIGINVQRSSIHIVSVSFFNLFVRYHFTVSVGLVFNDFAIIIFAYLSDFTVPLALLQFAFFSIVILSTLLPDTYCNVIVNIKVKDLTDAFKFIIKPAASIVEVAFCRSSESAGFSFQV